MHQETQSGGRLAKNLPVGKNNVRVGDDKGKIADTGHRSMGQRKWLLKAFLKSTLSTEHCGVLKLRMAWTADSQPEIVP